MTPELLTNPGVMMALCYASAGFFLYVHALWHA